MDIRPIRTEADYKAALREVSAYFDNEPEPGTEDGDRFEVLLTLVEAYEAKQFPVDLPDPIEAIKFRMDQLDMKKSELAEIIGYKSRVSEILSKKRKLTLQMIRKLHDKLNIPYETLITDY